MHRQKTRVAREVRVNINTLNAGRDQWARISDAKTGQILQTGQVKYVLRSPDSSVFLIHLALFSDVNPDED